jgi:hypothetical protein
MCPMSDHEQTPAEEPARDASATPLPAGPAPKLSGPLTAGRLLRLQATAGNAAVGRLLAARRTQQLARMADVAGLETPPRETVGDESVTAGPATETAQRDMDALREAVATRRVAMLTPNLSSSSSYNLSSLCFTPMPLSGPAYADAWGLLAHLFIEHDYEAKMGVIRGVDAYFDNPFAGPIDPFYVAFIIRKNRRLAAWKQVFLAVTSLQRPDVLLHDWRRRREFEEVKPRSIAGVFAGVQKIGMISAYMGLLGLPYRRGTTYTPTFSIPILSTSVGGVPVELWLKVERLAPGLIVYEYCIRTDWGLVAWAAVIAAILAILAIIFRGRIPIPAPTPAPIPIPIPA